MSTGYSARQRSASASSRPPRRSATPIDPRITNLEFDPCAATASVFLFAQGSSIICLHHDTLAVARRFELHNERILFLSVDNVSERGAGRLAVSYDSGQTAIVWDVNSGNEIARFASYEPIKVAAWMKNGNVAFGRTMQIPGVESQLANIVKATRREMSYYSSLRRRSISLRARYLIQLRLSRLLGTVRHLRLGSLNKSAQRIKLS